ncbi:hypothetical protein UFOVP42_20 [uncultured Caudovirales phage]|uniref:Uncharacterized protein n=1 Tax=uncultured Caudovirales phage TaxID=2100421 RepID=A0A6J5KSV4_9CAUD|nr:hypothetical protein UFOVP42_20 [uncultured Caudovirales phage]
MAIKYYVKAAISEYTDQSGATKKRYNTIGIVTETKKGDLMMKLEMIPLLGLKEGTLWCYLNVPEDKPEGKQSSQSLNNLDEDIPF